MEDVSPIYDNISIRDWADDLHHIKTRELEDHMKDKSDELKTLNVQARMEPMNNELRTNILAKLFEFFILQKRRSVLKNHKMQHEYTH